MKSEVLLKGISLYVAVQFNGTPLFLLKLCYCCLFIFIDGMLIFDTALRLFGMSEREVE
jgi:hypothetical protein